MVQESGKEHARERARASDEHLAVLAGQRKELAEAAELSENRLMLLLDQERQAAKESTVQLANQLAEMSDKAQSNREKAIELEATIRQMNARTGKLESDLAGRVAECSELSSALEAQETRGSLIQSEFEAYKEQYRISGDLGALQVAVAAMQATLGERDEE